FRRKDERPASRALAVLVFLEIAPCPGRGGQLQRAASPRRTVVLREGRAPRDRRTVRLIVRAELRATVPAWRYPTDVRPTYGISPRLTPGGGSPDCEPADHL